MPYEGRKRNNGSMDCKGFRAWLLKRGIERDLTREAMAHAEVCPLCRRMYEIDAGLEEFLSREFFSEAAMPGGLAEKVEFNLSYVEGDRKRVPGYRKMWLLFAAVAAAMLFVFFVYPAGGRFRSVEEIGRFAVENHLSHQAVVFTADEVRDVEGWFRDRLHFPVRMPDTKGLDLELIGGRKCNFGRKSAAYLFYSNRRTKDRSSIFVIDPQDIGFDVKEGATYHVTVNGRKVRFWKAGDAAYAMVE